ncbi:MAG: hypothetical protein ABF254_06815 [Octadecabacter sp.]
MRSIEPSIFGAILDTVAKAQDPEEYIAAVLAVYKQAYGTNGMRSSDESHVRDIFHRLNAFQALRSDPDFFAMFEASTDVIFGDLVTVIVDVDVDVDYALDDKGMASFDRTEVSQSFLALQSGKSH